MAKRTSDKNAAEIGHYRSEMPFFGKPPRSSIDEKPGFLGSRACGAAAKMKNRSALSVLMDIGRGDALGIDLRRPGSPSGNQRGQIFHCGFGLSVSLFYGFMERTP
jgi:hypothetical protein